MGIVFMKSEHLSIAFIRRIMLDKGYAWFDDNKAYNLNLIGIRSKNKQAGYFDDIFCIIYRSQVGQWCMQTFPCTTDPSGYFLKEPLHTSGTAILIPNQYRGAYKLGPHGKSKYKALRQIKSMKYWRDNNLDTILDFGVSEELHAIIYTNIHRANKSYISPKVRKHGAGCQVFQNNADFDYMLCICEMQVKLHGWETFTYTLLEENDFWGSD